VSQNNIPNIIDRNFKKGYQILIISGTNIADTTCHQMTLTASYLTQCLLLHYQRNADQAKYALKCAKT